MGSGAAGGAGGADGGGEGGQSERRRSRLMMSMPALPMQGSSRGTRGHEEMDDLEEEEDEDEDEEDEDDEDEVSEPNTASSLRIETPRSSTESEMSMDDDGAGAGGVVVEGRSVAAAAAASQSSKTLSRKSSYETARGGESSPVFWDAECTMAASANASSSRLSCLRADDDGDNASGGPSCVADHLGKGKRKQLGEGGGKDQVDEARGDRGVVGDDTSSAKFVATVAQAYAYGLEGRRRAVSGSAGKEGSGTSEVKNEAVSSLPLEPLRSAATAGTTVRAMIIVTSSASTTPLESPKKIRISKLSGMHRPEIYRHASRSLVDLHGMETKEKVEKMVREEEERKKRRTGELGMSRRANGSLEGNGEKGLLDGVEGKLRRRHSMPMKDPPSYFSLFTGLPPGLRQQGLKIQPREDEGMEKLPVYTNEIFLKAVMPRKMEFTSPGVQAKDRKWRRVLCVLEGTALKVYRCHARSSGVSAIGEWWESKVGVGDPVMMESGRPRSGGVIELSRGKNNNEGAEPMRSHSALGRLQVPGFAARLLKPGGSRHMRSTSEAGGRWRMSSGDGEEGEDNIKKESGTELIRAYSMQHAESGLGKDYTKRQHVIRVRLEGEQFLLQTRNVESVIGWIEGLQCAANVALDLDERQMPSAPMLPRRRRRRRQL